MLAASSSARPASPGRPPSRRTASRRFSAPSPRKRLKTQSLRPGSRRSNGSYQYQLNAGSGNTPILDQVLLGVGGTRSYTYGLAGHLEEVAAGANVIDFASDAEGRLASTGRAVADVAAGFRYDGRSFLTQAQETIGDPPTEAASVQSSYDSSGLLHGLRRKADPADPEELVLHLYLAGRPVAQLAIDGIGAETWTYLTTDHLGTPLLATDDAGSLLWQGGFEPFGKDYQQGTPVGALESGLFLRLPGQWDDPTWTDATSGASVYYNVHRWYALGMGGYIRLNPFGIEAGSPIAVLLQNRKPSISPRRRVTRRS